MASEQRGHRWLVVCGVATLVLVATGVIALSGLNTSRGAAWWTDDRDVRVTRTQVEPRRILWSPAKQVLPAYNTPSDEYEPRVSPDGRQMIFVRRRPGNNADLYLSQWSPAGGPPGTWSEPVPLDNLNTQADELGPTWSPDGAALYFYSDREGGLGGFDLWVVRRSSDDAADMVGVAGIEATSWGTPINLGSEVNSPWNEYGPAVEPDGLTLWFSSNRPRPDEPQAAATDAWPATVRERRDRHDYDLMISRVVDGAFAAAEHVTALNTTKDEGSPAISAAGDYVYFASDRPGGRGGFDLWRSRITKGTTSAPVALDESINSAANELDPALSFDGFRLYFSSDRSIDPVAPTASAPEQTPSVTVPSTPSASTAQPTHDYGLWWSQSREVVEEVEQAGPRWSWAQAWRSLWPWLLVLLLALLLLFGLLRMWADDVWRRRLGRLSLLAQCLLISMLIHAGMASLLAVWKVGQGIVDIVKQSSGTGTGGSRVSLVSSGTQGDLAGQIRGGFTTADAATEDWSGPAITAMPDRAFTLPDAPQVLASLGETAQPMQATSDSLAWQPRAQDESNADSWLAANDTQAPSVKTPDSARLPGSINPDTPVFESQATPIAAASTALPRPVPEDSALATPPDSSMPELAAAARSTSVDPLEAVEMRGPDASSTNQTASGPAVSQIAAPTEPALSLNAAGLPASRPADAPVQEAAANQAITPSSSSPSASMDAITQANAAHAAQASAQSLPVLAASAQSASTEGVESIGLVTPDTSSKAAPARIASEISSSTSGIPPSTISVAGSGLPSTLAPSSARVEPAQGVGASSLVASATSRLASPTMGATAEATPSASGLRQLPVSETSGQSQSLDPLPSSALAAGSQQDSSTPSSPSLESSTAAGHPVPGAALATPSRLPSAPALATGGSRQAEAQLGASSAQASAGSTATLTPSGSISLEIPANGMTANDVASMSTPSSVGDVASVGATMSAGGSRRAESTISEIAPTSVTGEIPGSSAASAGAAARIPGQPSPAMHQPPAAEPSMTGSRGDVAAGSIGRPTFDAAGGNTPSIPSASLGQIAAMHGAGSSIERGLPESVKVSGRNTRLGDAIQSPLSTAPPAGPAAATTASSGSQARLPSVPQAQAGSGSTREPSSGTAVAASPIATPSRGEPDFGAGSIAAPSARTGVASIGDMPLASTRDDGSDGFPATDAFGSPGGSRSSGSPIGVASAAPGREPGLPGLSAANGLGVARLPSVPPEPEPAGPVAPVETFEQRSPEYRDEMLAALGGDQRTEAAVKAALDWFTSVQEPDGRWSGKGFDDVCNCGALSEFDADAAMTGMALLCYLGAGHTHLNEGPYQESVAKAVHWLAARVGPNGDLRRGETMYGQTVATVALCEALAMTSDQTLAAPTRRAVRFIAERAISRERGASPQDTSVFGWLIMALESARRAGVDVTGVREQTFQAAGEWLDRVASSARPGEYAYRRGESPSAAMTAEAMFVQQILGHRRNERRMEQSARFVLATPPVWSNAKPGVEGAPTYYWYYATLALVEHQGQDGEVWRQWNEKLVPALVDNQRQDAQAKGSWDPQDRWSRMGGRIYQTAVCTLSLEAYYRYKPKGMPQPAVDGR